MQKYLKIVSPIIFLITLAVLFVFKTIPTSKMWKEYTVLYVPVESDDNEIINTLHNCSVKNEITLSNQYLPVTLPENSIEISMFKINRENPEYSYYINRNSYFFDKSQNYRLYYIPSEYKNNILQAISILNSKNIQAGIDSTSSYPWIIPVVLLFIILILVLFSKKKFLFFLSSFITCVYSFSNPFYNSGFSSLLIILIIFMISNLWQRKNSFNFLFRHYSLPVLFIISIVSAFSVSLKTGIYFLITIISISAFVFTYYSVEDFFNSKRSFNPVYILPAKKVSAFSRKTNLVMLSLISGSLILLAIFFMTSSKTINSHFSKLLLPSQTQIQDENLPTLEDYSKWIWNIKTYPYKSLNKSTLNDYYVEYPSYTSENGFVYESKNIMAYNQNFKENVLADIENLPFDSVEKLIKSEGENVITGYSASSTYTANLFSVIMMIICIFVLLFIYFCIIIRKEN